MSYPELSTVEIDTDGGPISIRDLYVYLQVLRAAYVECVRNMPEEISRRIDGDRVQTPEQLAQFTISEGRRLSGYSLVGVASTDLPSAQEFVLYDIQRRNPLELVIGGIAVAVAAAVVISGGEIKINKDGFHFKVRSLGQGIADIRRALSGKGGPPYQPRVRAPKPKQLK